MSLTDDDKQWIAAQLQHFHAEIQDVRARVEETETKLLRAIHDGASPVEMRARSHNAVLRVMDIEIESLSDRISKIERPQ